MPEDAERTSVCFTAAERQAIRWISEARRNQGNNRKTINDIVVDSIWYFIEKSYGKTKEQIEAMLPPVQPKPQSKIAQMPKKKH